MKANARSTKTNDMWVIGLAMLTFALILLSCAAMAIQGGIYHEQITVAFGFLAAACISAIAFLCAVALTILEVL